MQHLPPVYALLLLVLLAGCGQTGPLYLPDKVPPHETSLEAPLKEAPTPSPTETIANPNEAEL